MNKPIGVIDSGVGGLTVAKEIMRQLPNETIYYLGDIGRCPYGPRDKEEVCLFTNQLADYLVDHFDIKMLVIACNTATAVALKDLQKRLAIPVIGVIEPGARTAIMTTTNNNVLVLGTEGTIKSGAYRRQIMSINPNVKVSGVACPGFVPLVEQLRYDDPTITSIIIHQTLKQWRSTKADTVILGCTHYPLLYKPIHDYFDGKKTVISSGLETAREVSALLTFSNEHAHYTPKPKHRFFANGSTVHIERIIKHWLKIDQSVEQISIQ
ncbi:glutamate racemase [Staphylococcus massiliensis]|uniref:Glutamate racemase n=1 Tax=Staphylococcus massiliensis S46 TaxID=1229783 RepID=K9ACJ2_9STAP|nr:glutamate racemase [Staphylococcus massiliensis]EKU45054.1 glutamate racemase [Staphylococcus massiliensis S46]MCG3400570.1 glutamate racemase [Staphylococcus massiliensis]MCG3401437.1 glutamate racemase [Staphylococcus massiliensis]MCG3411780.1 glutamate racemase [Staphylococcus massiliensis]PNZ97756.1 glutamate racemase [Staphylococcus massiliensis CCUG 55927]